MKVETNLDMIIGVSLLIRKDELEEMNDANVLSVATSMIIASSDMTAISARAIVTLLRTVDAGLLP